MATRGMGGYSRMGLTVALYSVSFVLGWQLENLCNLASATRALFSLCLQCMDVP